MISAVSNWVKAVAAVGVLVAFVDMMAPKGALRRSVDMTIALVVVAAIVGPVVEIGAALLPAAERAFASQGGQARAAAATSGIADGLELCLSYGLQAAYPDVADGWHVRVTLGELQVRDAVRCPGGHRHRRLDSRMRRRGLRLQRWPQRASG